MTIRTPSVLLGTLIAATLCLGATSAFAQKSSTGSTTPATGEITIDQTKAINGAVTVGDSAGFPISITQPGRYKLTSNLVVPAGTAGIQISAPDVVLDLNGYSIAGTQSCGYVQPQLTCLYLAGTPVGVFASDSATVINGTVQGFSRGIRMSGGLVENVTVRSNTIGIAIDVATQPGRISGVMAHANGTGIQAYGSLIERAVVVSNATGINGIGSSSQAVVMDSIVRNNTTGMTSVFYSRVQFMGNVNNGTVTPF